MAGPRDERDETLDDDGLPDDLGDTLDDEAFILDEDDAATTIDESSLVQPIDTADWSVDHSNAATLESGDLGVDMEEMKRIWGFVDPSVGTQMTVKVDDILEPNETGDVFGTDDFDDEAPAGPPAETIAADASDGPPSDPNLETLADDSVVADGGEGTLADDALLDDDGHDATLDDDVEFSISDSASETLPDDPAAVPPSADVDATFVVDDDDEDSVEDPDQTFEYDLDAGAGNRGDATVVLEDDEFDDERVEPDRTISDDPEAARGGDDNDRTFVLSDEAGPDGTVVLPDAEESADSGSFADPETIDDDRDPHRTVAGEDAVGSGGGEADTWDPHDQARTFVSGGSASAGSASDSIGAEVGITVRPRSFATGDATDPAFGADYAIIRQLGQGGMGVVFMAKQTSVDREVAVKMLKPVKSGKKQTAKKLANQRTKFLAEAVVTGDLDHPNIVPIYDLGTDEAGAVFYSMKCVKGTPWDDVVGDKSLIENLEILNRVADAVAFAHNRGVVHRDLKPENVMLGDFGEVLLMDWGLALTNETFTKAGNATKTGSIGGTPSYMAPEMAAGDISKVGTHSDIYLLGAILYEIVAGHPPHAGADVMKCLYNAAKNVIVPTDRSGELVDIALKAMSSKRRDRYRTVRDFQDAIREYQSHSESIAMAMRAAEDLVEAKRSNEYEGFARAMYGFEEAHELWPGNARAVRGISEARLAYATSAMNKGDLDLANTLLRDDDPSHAEVRRSIVAAQRERDGRQKRLALMKRVSLAAGILLMVTATGAAVWINAEKTKAETARDEAKRQEGLAIEAKEEAVVARDDAREARDDALEAQQAAEDAARSEAFAKGVALEARDKAIEEERKAKAAAFDSWISEQFAQMARDAADEARKVAVDAREQEAIQRTAAETQRELARTREVEALFSGYETEIEKSAAEYASAVAEVERLAADIAREQEAAAKVAAKEAEQEAIDAKDEAIEAKNDAQAAERQALIAREEAIEAKEQEEYEAYVAQIGLASAKIRENAFDSARDLLEQCKPELRNWEWGRLMHLCSQSSRDFSAGGPVDAIDISPDGKIVAAGTWTGDIVLWDRETGRELRRINEGGLYVNAVAFSPDGKLLATGSSDANGYVKLWDVATGERVDTKFEGHTDGVLSVAFDGAGRRLLTSSYDNTARIWNVDGSPIAGAAQSGGKSIALTGHSWWVWTAVFDPQDENRVVTASQDGTVGVWDVANRSLVTQFTGHDGPVFCAAVSPDGRRVVSGGYDKRILVWDPSSVKPFDFEALAEGAQQSSPEFRTLTGHNGAVRSIRFGHEEDSSVIVTGGHDNTVRIWDLDGRRGEEQIKVFRGHDGWVRSAALSPDGRWLVSGSQDETAKLWTIAEYEELRVLRGRSLEGHSDAVLAADFSRDGEQVVTASRDRTARTYDVHTGEMKHVLQEGHAFLASSSVFFPGGSRMATAAADDTTRIWDVRTGTQIVRLEGTGRAAAIGVSGDGRFLLTGGQATDVARNDWVAKIWDLETHELLRTLPGHTTEVTAVALSPDGRVAYTGTANGTGQLWDVETGKRLHLLSGHTERIYAAAFLPDGSRVLTAGGDHVVSQWDVRTGKEQPELLLKHGSGVRAMGLGPKGETVVTSADDGRIRLFRTAGGEPIATLGGTTNGVVSAVDISSDGTKVVSTHSTTNTVKVWNVATRKEIPIKLADGESRSFLDWSQRRTPIWSARFAPEGTAILTVGGADARLWDLRTGEERLSFSPHGAVAAAGFSPNGKLVVTGSWDFSAKVWSTETGRAVQKLQGAHEGFVNAARFSPDGKYVLTASDDHTARLWDLDSATVVRVFRGHRGPVMHAAFSADGKRIVTASTDTTARIWNVETGEEIAEIAGHDWGVLSAELSRDGLWVVTGSEDNTARLWELTDDGPVERFLLAGHTAAVTSVAFSPDRTRVLTGSRDDTVKLWDAATGKEILTLDGHDEPVTAVTFSPDGRYALTASRDGRAIVWLAVGWNAAAAVASHPEGSPDDER